MRTPLPGNRRYRITHRAVQRLRELVAVGEPDDEALRDMLDQEIVRAEDAGKAVRTLDVMLGNKQVLIPLAGLGELYAIVKEDTVVTVLPRAHGEELVQRGEALQRQVGDCQARTQPPQRDDMWGLRARRREELAGERFAPAVAGRSPPVTAEPEIVIRPSRSVITRARVGRERFVSGDTAQPEQVPRAATQPALAPTLRLEHALVTGAQPERAEGTLQPEHDPGPTAPAGQAPTVAQPEPTAGELARPLGAVAGVIARGLELGRRRAAICALAETIRREPPDSPLLPLWRTLIQTGLVETLTIGDLIAAVRTPLK